MHRDREMWGSFPFLPTEDEISSQIPEPLPIYRVCQTYSSVDEYLSTHFSTHSEVLFKVSARTLFQIISVDKIYWNPMWGSVDNIGIQFIVMDNICR